MKTLFRFRVAAGLTLFAATPWAWAQPVITKEPSFVAVSAGATVTLTVGATSTNGPISYQWRFETVDMDPAANPTAAQDTLILTNATAANAGRYYVVVSDAGGSVISRTVKVTVDSNFAKITTGGPVTDVGCCWESGSWADYDGDGYPDLFVPRYNVGLSTLYRNNRDGTFTSLTNAPFARSGGWESAAWADFDNDGHPDLYVAAYNSAGYFYFNDGSGAFSSIPAPKVLPFSVSAVDFNHDGRLDVFVPGMGGASMLLRNDGAGSFTKMTPAQVGTLVSLTVWGGATWADYDDDGYMDVYVGDSGGKRSLLYHNDGTGHFTLVTNAVTQPTTSAPVVGAWGDYDNDGRLDMLMGCGSGISVLFHNVGNGEFEAVSLTPKLGTCYSVIWVDYDNDGFLDVFMTFPNALYHNNGDGTFTKVTNTFIGTDVAPGADASYSGLWFDYDNDGFLDVYVFNGNTAGTAKTTNFLYHNLGNSNAWLKVKLVGTASNRDGVGAKVRVQATYAGQSRWQRRDTSAGDGVNGNQLIAHFGLGDATNVDVVRIEWPSGAVQQIGNVAVKQALTVWEPPALQAAVQPDGACVLNIRAEPNRAWQIQGSIDLVTWETLATLTPTTVAFQYTDSAAAGMGCRFYRLFAE